MGRVHYHFEIRGWWNKINSLVGLLKRQVGFPGSSCLLRPRPTWRLWPRFPGRHVKYACFNEAATNIEDYCPVECQCKATRQGGRGSSNVDGRQQPSGEVREWAANVNLDGFLLEIQQAVDVEWGCNYKMNWMPEEVGLRLARDFPRSACFVYLFATDRNRKHERKWPENKAARLSPNRPPFPRHCVIANPFFQDTFPLRLHAFASSPKLLRRCVRTPRNFHCGCQGVGNIGLLFHNAFEFLLEYRLPSASYF